MAVESGAGRRLGEESATGEQDGGIRSGDETEGDKRAWL